LQAGESLGQVLAAYPHRDAEFRPMLEAAQAARFYAHYIRVPMDAQDTSRSLFLEAAGEMIPRQAGSRRRLNLRLVWIGLGLLLAITVAVWLLVGLSSAALPGDWLYPIKLLEEQVRLRFTRDPGERISLEFTMDQERAQEVEALLRRGRSQEVVFSGGLQQMEPGIWQVGGFRVLIPPQTRVIGDIQPGYDVIVHGLTRPEGDVIASQVQMRELNIEGHLEELSDDQWVVGGVSVKVTPDSTIQGSPEVGSRINVIARRALQGSLHARLIEVLAQ
jgi:hypothetical protein